MVYLITFKKIPAIRNLNVIPGFEILKNVTKTKRNFPHKIQMISASKVKLFDEFSETWLDDLLLFWRLYKTCINDLFAQIAYILGQFLNGWKSVIF